MIAGSVAFAFYSQEISCDGIAIRASAAVSPRALTIAREKLQHMLARMPAAKANLVSEGVELHIIGKDENPSDLPELAHWRGKTFSGNLTIDQRTRGVGGHNASCGEENLLQLSEDRYHGRDICLHEFAHTLMAYGLDDTMLDAIYSGRLSPPVVTIKNITPMAPQYEGQLTAARQGMPTTLLLLNKSNAPVKVFWLNNRGERRPSGEIEPGGQHRQKTYAGHPFLLTDEAGHGLVIFVAEPTAGKGIWSGR